MAFKYFKKFLVAIIIINFSTIVYSNDAPSSFADLAEIERIFNVIRIPLIDIKK